MILKECNHAFENLARPLPFNGNAGSRQLAGLPDIMVVGFDDRDVELLMQARQDGFDLASFSLKGVASRDVEREG